MYELAIESLKKLNDELKQKIPTVEESVRTYSQMTDNYKMELEHMHLIIFENEEAIKMLESMEDDVK